jgi:hypothetical protein
VVFDLQKNTALPEEVEGWGAGIQILPESHDALLKSRAEHHKRRLDF